MENGLLMCDERWSEYIAVGSLEFVESIQRELAAKRCIVLLNRETEPMRCVNRVRLTMVFSVVKVPRINNPRVVSHSLLPGCGSLRRWV